MMQQPDVERRSGGARIARGLVAVCLIGAGATAGWLGARRLSAAPVSGGELETAVAEHRTVGASVLATGIVRPATGAQVAVGSRVSGVLRKLHVTAGDPVVAGQLLAELDRVEFATQVARATAALASAEAEARYAADALERTRLLADRLAATPAELSAATRLYETAVARRDEAAAALDAARVQLDFTTIRAPIDGVVGDISTQEGETVAASFAAPTFLTIVDLSRLEVQAYIDETDIGRIEPGQRARFTVDAWPDAEFEGVVTAIRPTAEVIDNVVNYITLIRIEHREGLVLRPEMTATVVIAMDSRENVLSVPNGALRRDSDGSYVRVATAGGIERRGVEVAFRGSGFTEIAAGLREGERVVVGTIQSCMAAE